MEGKGLLQKNMLMHSTNLDVQEQYSLYFCQEIDQTDIVPEKKSVKRKDSSVETTLQKIDFSAKYRNQAHFSCIMNNGEI